MASSTSGSTPAAGAPTTTTTKQTLIGAPSLNVYKKITFVRGPENVVTFEDAEGNVKSLTSQDLADAIVTSMPNILKKKPKDDIPVPQINVVESYTKDVPAAYDIQQSYVRYHRQTEREWRESVTYVADADDEAWLKNNTKFGAAAVVAPIPSKPNTAEDVDTGDQEETIKVAPQLARRPQLTLGAFERMMDLLEKATAFEVIITLQQAENLILSKMPELVQLFPVHVKGRSVVKFKQVVNDVYAYWVSKRSRLKRPLLRRYWPVTSSDDTNPHLVFRPREKEKYKLRKKRQNDLEAFQKMKRLRNDFDNLRAILTLVKRREELHRAHIQLQVELFHQRLYDVVDTSGVPRVSDQLQKEDITRVLDIPLDYDPQVGGRKVKRVRDMDDTPSSVSSSMTAAANAAADQSSANKKQSKKDVRVSTHVAGRNQGLPAPSFLHPLDTRESYVTSWDNAVPHVPSYMDAHAAPTFIYRNRPRVGRGGRLCIDRLPLPPPHRHIPPQTVLRAGLPQPPSSAVTTTSQHLLDLLPLPLDAAAISRKIQEISIAAIQEDADTAKAMVAATAGLDPDENDGEELIVRMDDWLESDDQVWGEERYSIGPI